MADVETIFDKFSSLVKTLDYRDVFRIQASKMQSFAKLVRGFESSTIFCISSILDF